MSTNQNEKREYLRYRCDKPVNFKILASPKDSGDASKFVSGISKNLSASGILFSSAEIPEISSVLALDLDYRTTNLCREIEEHVLLVNTKLIGKVVRIEQKDDGSYDIGVAFIKKCDHLPAEIENLLK